MENCPAQESNMEFSGTPRKPMKIGSVQTVNLKTGEVSPERPNVMTLIPPPDGVCPECAVDHPHENPHDQQSIYYQYYFYASHGRWPTWTDAMAHCTDAVKLKWREWLVQEMRKRNLPIPEDLLEPKPTGR